MLRCTTEGAALSRKSGPASLAYEYPALRQGEPCPIRPGLYGVRFALPFALDHVHIWLAQEDGGWTVIDTGLADEPTLGALA